MGKTKIIACKEGKTDIILILNGKAVIEEYTDDVRAKNRWFQRKDKLKAQGKRIVHEIDAEPEKKLEIIRGRIMRRPMRFKRK